MSKKILGGLFGVAIGDALGVPVEFASRRTLSENPVKGMIGYGSHNQPPGTWSDDTSLTLCLVESLCECGYDLVDLGHRFVRWYRDGYWTPCGNVFDIGNATRQAILRLENGIEPILAGPADEQSNGNGSLMRVLPASLYFASCDEAAMLDAVGKISCLTHRHPRSLLGCVLYTLLVKELLKEDSPHTAYDYMRERAQKLCKRTILSMEMPHYQRIISGALPSLAEKDIHSSGYVVDTLEAAIWCLLNSGTFSETVLKAVNLGSDSDTTGAVAGGLAGILYGYDSIPQDWLKKLARFEDISVLVMRFAQLLNENAAGSAEK